MPPDARDLFAEGAVITPCALMRDDRVVDETVDLLIGQLAYARGARRRPPRASGRERCR